MAHAPGPRGHQLINHANFFRWTDGQMDKKSPKDCSNPPTLCGEEYTWMSSVMYKAQGMVLCNKFSMGMNNGQNLEILVVIEFDFHFQLGDMDSGSFQPQLCSSSLVG